MSFAASTAVLLASGKKVPISQLRPGDKVLATSTRTGKTKAEPVAAVLVHYDTDLYNLTVTSGGHTAVIRTTASHLFWDPYQHQWIASNKLSKGEHLKTPDGTLAVADGGTTPKVHDGWMWDLTVPGNNDHDFYVVTSNAAILVHNDVCRVLPSRFGSKTIAVLGRRDDINVARSFSGHEVLSLNRFGKTPWRIWRNDEWVQGIINKGQRVYLASPITDETLFDPLAGYDQTIFAREVNQLLEGGYAFSDDGQYMLPSGS